MCMRHGQSVHETAWANDYRRAPPTLWGIGTCAPRNLLRSRRTPTLVGYCDITIASMRGCASAPWNHSFRSCEFTDAGGRSSKKDEGTDANDMDRRGPGGYHPRHAQPRKHAPVPPP